ncbi:class I SAM-dependent methyltransferase [Nitrosomonas aestuarii]|uniref:class I SAM-dependent methyltransferase n=1 Tax=Nitrosomonas aestuarii TaxID=52441 RepID=UPI000D2F7E5A|nr:methyltransferase domain-containing protein [Nitrosomonas aestuarii]PTN11552.1 methyltransferase family protein [Nitrosomonas aestuarii]
MAIQTDQQWFSTSLGQYIVDHEFQYFDQVVANIFGYNAMQMGMPQYDFLRTNRMPLRFTAGTEHDNTLRSACNHLPITGETIDLIIVPHVLEFNKDPHQILREVYRILIPEGHIVISGFNPISLWGLHHHFVSNKNEFPWNGHFIALPRLKDWLKLLNFEIKGGKLCCYAPPFEEENWRQRFNFMEDAGDRWWPISGGVYFLHAIKHKCGMHIIKPGWKTSLVGKKKIAAATQRIKR